MNISDRNFLRELGYRIRERRLAHKWTQAQLAENVPSIAPSSAPSTRRA